MWVAVGSKQPAMLRKSPRDSWLSGDFLAHISVEVYIHLLQQHVIYAFINNYIKRKSFFKKSTQTLSKLKVQDYFHTKRLQNLWPFFKCLIFKVSKLKWFMELLMDYDPPMYCSSTIFRYHFPTKVFIGMQ